MKVGSGGVCFPCWDADDSEVFGEAFPIGTLLACATFSLTNSICRLLFSFLRRAF